MEEAEKLLLEGIQDLCDAFLVNTDWGQLIPQEVKPLDRQFLFEQGKKIQNKDIQRIPLQFLEGRKTKCKISQKQVQCQWAYCSYIAESYNTLFEHVKQHF